MSQEECLDSEDDSVNSAILDGVGKKNSGVKKQNFLKWQTKILKKWFITNADNPYLKEENRKELSEKTGLD